MSPQRGGQVAAALLLDGELGEPPETIHPTVLMGLVISAFEKRALRLESPRSRRLAGIVLAVSTPSLVFVSTRKILGFVPCKPRWITSSGGIRETCRNPRSAGPPWNRSQRTRATVLWPPCSTACSSVRQARWHTRL